MITRSAARTSPDDYRLRDRLAEFGLTSGEARTSNDDPVPLHLMSSSAVVLKGKQANARNTFSTPSTPPLTELRQLDWPELEGSRQDLNPTPVMSLCGFL
jgi:hypothetical protein